MHCDGCGKETSQEHIRQRIERLELSTRYRPIHIGVLLLTAAPPPRFDDFFYRPSRNRADRSVYWRMFFEEIAAIAGIAGSAASDEEAVLAKFQHQGFFLAHCCECPLDEAGATDSLKSGAANAESVALLYGAIVAQRIKASYKPKQIVPIGFGTEEIVAALLQAGFQDQLILDSGRSFIDPYLGDPAGSAEFQTGLADRIRKSLRHLVHS